MSERSDDQVRADLASLRIDRSARPQRRKKRSPWAIIGAIAALGIVAAILWALSAAASATEVEIGFASRRASASGGDGGEEILAGSGYVVTGDRYISIGVRVPGRIEKYFIEEGQRVEAGAPLVRLDDRDYRAIVSRIEAQMEVARANLGLARAELARGETLRRSKVASLQELDVLRNKAAVAQATIGQLEAEMAQAKINLDYTQLRAPTDGVILAKLKEVGEIATPGGFAGSGDLVRMANLTDLRAELDVSESDLSRVRMGGAARVAPDAYPDRTYEARVVKLYPQVNRQKGTLKVEVQILEPDDKLLPDMSARITFVADATSAEPTAEPPLTIPSAAIRKDGEGSFVWLVDGDRVTRRAVRTGTRRNGRAEVLSGLSGGESVVVGDVDLTEGEAVRSGAT